MPTVAALRNLQVLRKPARLLRVAAFGGLSLGLSGCIPGAEKPELSLEVPASYRAAAKGDANNRSRHLTQPTLCLAFDLAISRSKDRQERLQPRVLEAYRRK